MHLPRFQCSSADVHQPTGWCWAVPISVQVSFGISGSLCFSFREQAVIHNWYCSLSWGEMSFTSFWRPTCPPLCSSCCPGFLSGSHWIQCLQEPALVSYCLRKGEDLSRQGSLRGLGRRQFSWALCSVINGLLTFCFYLWQNWVSSTKRGRYAVAGTLAHLQSCVWPRLPVDSQQSRRQSTRSLWCVLEGAGRGGFFYWK